MFCAWKKKRKRNTRLICSGTRESFLLPTITPPTSLASISHKIPPIINSPFNFYFKTMIPSSNFHHTTSILKNSCWRPPPISSSSSTAISTAIYTATVLPAPIWFCCFNFTAAAISISHCCCVLLFQFHTAAAICCFCRQTGSFFL
jgi:hypothetical protein